MLFDVKSYLLPVLNSIFAESVPARYETLDEPVSTYRLFFFLVFTSAPVYSSATSLFALFIALDLIVAIYYSCFKKSSLFFRYFRFLWVM